jgi:alkylation response protein AidB-like acyl-CoA dehydrogenase
MSFEPSPKVQELQRRITAFPLRVEGRGFKIAQGRLGPVRIQVGLAERAPDSGRRSLTRVAFGRRVEKVVDWTMQAHGAAGTGNDFLLARAEATSRVLRIADGLGEVHHAQIGRLEPRKYPQEA